MIFRSGGDLQLLGEIPEDPAMERAVRSYLPVTEREPAAPASVALAQIADTLLQTIQAKQAAA